MSCSLIEKSFTSITHLIIFTTMAMKVRTSIQVLYFLDYLDYSTTVRYRMPKQQKSVLLRVFSSQFNFMGSKTKLCLMSIDHMSLFSSRGRGSKSLPKCPNILFFIDGCPRAWILPQILMDLVQQGKAPRRYVKWGHEDCRCQVLVMMINLCISIQRNLLLFQTILLG